MRLIPARRDYRTATAITEAFHANYPFIVNDALSIEKIDGKVVCKPGDEVRKYMLLEWRIPCVTLRYNQLKQEVNVNVTTREYIDSELSRKFDNGWIRTNTKAS